MVTKHEKVVTLHEGFPPINLHNHLNMCSCEVIWQIKNAMSPLSMFMFYRLTRVVTYCEELQPVYLHDPSMRWSYKVLWQIKYIISPLAGHLKAQNLARYRDYVTNVTSRGNLENAYFHLHKTYGY